MRGETRSQRGVTCKCAPPARGAVLVLLAVAIAACGDESTRDLPSGPSVEVMSADARTALLSQAARSLAMALADADVRQKVLEDLRSSPFPEHKIELGRYLQGQGAAVHGEMEVHSRTGGVAAHQLRGMEFYMPLAKHRAEWSGGSNVMVAVHNQRDDDAPAEFAFTTSGRLVPLDSEHPPAIPTLVIGRVENDFSEAPSRAGWINVGSAGVIGNWHVAPENADYAIAAECDPLTSVEPCDDGSGGGSTSTDEGFQTPAGAVHTRGVGVREFIDQMWAMNDHEPWDKGAPEFQVFIIGTSDAMGDAELRNEFLIPEDPWAGSDDEMNNDTREFGAWGLRVATWDSYWGEKVWVKCIEKDVSTNQENLSVSGPVPFTDPETGVKYTVNVSAIFNDVTGGYDDNCGSLDQSIAPDGNWTPIFSEEDTEQNKTNNWHGTNDLRWNGYGIEY